MLMGALVTFLVVILILYLINLLPLDGRAKQIARVVVIILGVISLLKYIAVFYGSAFPRRLGFPAPGGENVFGVAVRLLAALEDQVAGGLEGDAVEARR